MASRTTSEWSPEHTSDDDDIEFELASEDSTMLSPDDEELEPEDMSSFFDAEEGASTEAGEQSGAEITIHATEEEEQEEGGEGSRTPQAAQPTTRRREIMLTQHEILQLLAHAGLRGYFGAQGARVVTRAQARAARAPYPEVSDEDEEDEEGDEEDDEDDNDAYAGYGLRRKRTRRRYKGDRYPKIPSEEGTIQMHSGTFGLSERCDHSACGKPFPTSTMHKRKTLARRMLDREMGLSAPGLSQHPRTMTALATQSLLPTSEPDLIVNMDERCYSGQFSDDGSFFFACGKDFRVRMYDTSNPYDWKYYKTVHYYGGQWTITDASLSPNNKLLAYASIRSQVCLANTDKRDTSEPALVDVSDMGRPGNHGNGYGREHFGIWSLRFSGDGNEIICGASDHCVYVYDLEAGRSTLRIPGHMDHVNAVCYGDKMSPHILYSGSDDTTLKVWDRRSLASMRPAGMFLGHTEGLTYIDSKGDGRYVISNGKDQTCKLWDLRRMIATEDAQLINPQDFTTNFDYRYSPYDTSDHIPHPHDCSLVTFHGHRVLKTLIRCHFSPPGSTNGRYIYSGSHDGKVWIWNLDGTTAGQIDVNEATTNTRPPTDELYMDHYDNYGSSGRWKTIVRDCSWHPHAPVIAATSWNGQEHMLGSCTVYSWNDGTPRDEVDPEDPSERGNAHANAAGLGSAPRGARVTPQLRYDAKYYADFSASARRRRPRRGLGALFADSDD